MIGHWSTWPAMMAEAVKETPDKGFLDFLCWRLGADEHDHEAVHELEMAALVAGCVAYGGYLTGKKPAIEEVPAAVLRYWRCVYGGHLSDAKQWSRLAADVVNHIERCAS
jgi:hypothetical protein